MLYDKTVLQGFPQQWEEIAYIRSFKAVPMAFPETIAIPFEN